jgi:hypothetical protein
VGAAAKTLSVASVLAFGWQAMNLVTADGQTNLIGSPSGQKRVDFCAHNSQHMCQDKKGFGVESENVTNSRSRFAGCHRLSSFNKIVIVVVVVVIAPPHIPLQQ